MNFFERQEDARRKSFLLLIQFVVAVALIILAVNFATWLLLSFHAHNLPGFWQWTHTSAFWIIAAVTAGIILIGSLRQYLKLRTGGDAVALMAGARPLDPETRDEKERRFINVVEEMSIAAGVAMPRLYIMDREESINAFVAGHRPDQAVMAVTRGALEQLSRDELQGVVGHEFSHIVNGDMSLNLRLMAVLAGILALGQLGEFLLRSARHSSRSRDRRSSGGIILLWGLCLVIVGYVGLFLSRLIKAAISRQREYLADAASVQFTRNPQGLAGALYRIKNAPLGSLLTATSHAEDVNHICFGETLKLRFSSLLASHPPLDERIKAIDPLYLRRVLARQKRAQQEDQQQASSSQTIPSLASGLNASGDSLSSPFLSQTSTYAAPLAAAPLDTLGLILDQHHRYARQLLSRWPDELRQWVRQPASAKALIAALLVLETDNRDRDRAVSWLRSLADELDMDVSLLDQALSMLPSLGKESRLPIVELCLGSLKGLLVAERVRFVDKMVELAGLDGRHRLFEFILISLLRRQLAADAARAPQVRFHSFRPVLEDISRLLAVLARQSANSLEEFRTLHAEAMRSYGQAEANTPPRCTLAELDASFRRLAQLSPLLKQPVLQSCADLILKDGRVAPEEYELLRATAELLDCPLPPLAR